MWRLRQRSEKIWDQRLVEKIWKLRERIEKKWEKRLRGNIWRLVRRNEKKKDQRLEEKMWRLRQRSEKIWDQRLVEKMWKLRRRNVLRKNVQIQIIGRVSIFNVRRHAEKNNSNVFMSRTISGMQMNYHLMISLITLRRIQVPLLLCFDLWLGYPRTIFDDQKIFHPQLILKGLSTGLHVMLDILQA